MTRGTKGHNPSQSTLNGVLSSKDMMAKLHGLWKNIAMMQVSWPSPSPSKLCFSFVLFACAAVRLAAQSDQTVYTDSLQNGWQNWSWATVNLGNGSPVHGSGANSVSVSSTNWQALFLHHTAQNGSTFSTLTFWINGGSIGGQVVRVQATRSTVAQTNLVTLAPLPVNSWRQETIPLSLLGVASATDFDGFWLQVENSGLAPTFYVDDIALAVATNTPATSGPVTITVNAALSQRPISPLIYGVAFASSSQLSELNSPLNRSGGNAESRYNWQLSAHGRGADWYFESIPDASATPGSAADSHVASSKNAGAQPMLTIPMLGWVPKLTPGRSYLASYSITKYGPQTDHDTSYIAWYDFGNGIGTNPATQTSWLITTNDPTDANFPTNSAYQQEWIKHLTNAWGLSTNGGVRYYCLDNEHTLWHSTHRDVHPIGTTMREIRDRLFDYGAKVKAIDPNALLAAPEEWGWPGYLYSGYDWQWAGAHNDYNSVHFPDRSTNGGWDYGPWLLNQARQYELTNGQRLIDVFTYHIYPQGANEWGDNVTTATQLGRNRSTRALWDTNYVDQSWINSVIKLIPRMREWVAAYYPGTKIGVTEYNWGAENHINGATAQADILGIFGREGLGLATRWTTPGSSTFTFKAMKMYRNYDGSKSVFGDTSVFAGGPNPDNVSCFAARRSSDGALTVMVINKQLGTNVPVNVSLANFLPAGTAQVWRLTSANTITHLSDISFTGGTFSNTLPSQSITLFVLAAGSPPGLRTVGAASNTFTLWLDGQTGQRYALLSSSDFVNWNSVQTNQITNSSQQITVPLTNMQRFYRAEWLP